MKRNENKRLGQTRLAVARAGHSKSDCFTATEERVQLANEIHRRLAQAFDGILLHLEAAFEVGEPGQPRASGKVEHLGSAKDLAQRALDDTLRMLQRLGSADRGDTSLASGLVVPVDGRRSACFEISAAENHKNKAEGHSRNGFDAWNRLVREMANSPKQHAFGAADSE